MTKEVPHGQRAGLGAPKGEATCRCDPALEPEGGQGV